MKNKTYYTIVKYIFYFFILIIRKVCTQENNDILYDYDYDDVIYSLDTFNHYGDFQYRYDIKFNTTINLFNEYDEIKNMYVIMIV